MNCPYCGHETQVTNSRPQKRLNQIWRRRKCLNCKSIFTTNESLEANLALRVLKDDELLPFNRDVLFLSIYESCKHRPKAIEEAHSLTNTIISKLTPQANKAVIDRAQIINTAQKVLKNFDKAAFIHYGAYHLFPDQ